MAKVAKKKWYKDVQTLLTFVGIVISLALSIFNIVKANQKDKAASVSETLDSIDKSITELISLDQKSADYSENSVQSNLFLRRKIIVASLSQKVSSIEDQISPQVFLFIGQEYVRENDYSEAENFFNKALGKIEKTDFQTRALVFGSLAHLYGVKKENTRKDEFWEKQIAEVEKIAIPERYLTLSNTYQAAALTEYDFGNHQMASSLIDSAIYYLEKTDLSQTDRIIRDLRSQQITESIRAGDYHLPLTRLSLSTFVSTEFRDLFENGLGRRLPDQATVRLLKDFGLDSLHQLVQEIPPGLADLALRYNLSDYDGLSLIEWVLIIRDRKGFLNYYPNDTLSALEIELSEMLGNH